MRGLGPQDLYERPSGRRVGRAKSADTLAEDGDSRVAPWPPLDLRMSHAELRSGLAYLADVALGEPADRYRAAVLDAFLVAVAIYQCEVDALPAPMGLSGVRPVRSGLLSLIDLLSDEVVRGIGATDDEPAQSVLAPWPKIVAGAARPWLSRRMFNLRARLPACFRSMDLAPEDCRALAGRLVSTEAMPGLADRGVVVVGLRTSGCYLAPLVAAALRRRGVRSVQWVTLRPGKEPDRWTSGCVRRAGGQGCAVAIVDDPPASGRTIDAAVRLLRRLLPAGAELVALLPLTGTDAPPIDTALLSRVITLPWQDWHVVKQMRPEALRTFLGEVLAGKRVGGEDAHDATVSDCLSVERGPLSLPGRGHTGCHVRATLMTKGGSLLTREFFVQGVGVGYLGAHALKIHRLLSGYVPCAYGLGQGLLVREHLPEAGRLSEVDFRHDPEVRRHVVDYVAERAARLSLDARDLGRVPCLWGGPAPLGARKPVASSSWRAVVDACGPWAGPLGRLARALALDAETRSSGGAGPCLIDGDMGPGRWYRWGGSGGLYKTGAHQRALSNYDLDCTDPLFDVAGAATGAWPPPVVGDVSARHVPAGAVPEDEVVAALAEKERLEVDLRLAWEAATGEAVDGARWFSHLFLQHGAARRQMVRAASSVPGASSGWEVLEAWSHEQLAARALQHFLGWLYAPARLSGAVGPLVAIDIDGVLETRWMGIPAAAPAGLRSLSALSAHGLSPVLATGRPLGEMRSRCLAYGLIGGVAEYGSCIWVTEGERAESLVPPEGLAALQRLRAVLEAFPRVFVHPGSMSSLRASVVTVEGFLALPSGLAGRAIRLAQAEGLLAYHQGRYQTDFIAGTMDKAKGLQALASALGLSVSPQGPVPLLAAVGDDEPDLAMLAAASTSFVPKQSPEVLRAVARGLPGKRVELLPKAAQLLIGHRVGACKVCRVPAVRACGLEPVLGALLDVRGAGATRRAIALYRATRGGRFFRASRAAGAAEHPH